MTVSVDDAPYCLTPKQLRRRLDRVEIEPPTVAGGRYGVRVWVRGRRYPHHSYAPATLEGALYIVTQAMAGEEVDPRHPGVISRPREAL